MQGRQHVYVSLRALLRGAAFLLVVWRLGGGQSRSPHCIYYYLLCVDEQSDRFDGVSVNSQRLTILFNMILIVKAVTLFLIYLYCTVVPYHFTLWGVV